MLSIAFLIPLKSSKYASNSFKFKKLLKETLVNARKVPNSKTIIVCNTNDFSFELSYLVDKVLYCNTDQPYGDADKNIKVLVGCRYWLDTDPTSHLMILDMDDLVSPEIAKSVFSSKMSTVLCSGYQKIFNRYYLYNKNFNEHCGSSFIFSRSYIEKEVNSVSKDTDFSKWMFHRNHDLLTFNKETAPYVIQKCWHGENVWWKKRRLRDSLKWFFSSKTLDSFPETHNVDRKKSQS